MKCIKFISLFIFIFSLRLMSQGPCGVLTATNVKIVPQVIRTGSVYCVGNQAIFSVSSTPFPLILSSMSWTYSGTSGTSFTTNPNSYSLLGLTTGGSVTATGSVNVSGTNCFFTRTYTVIINLAANAGPDLVLNITQAQASIGGAPTATGGLTPYTYTWSPSTGISSGINSSNSTIVPGSNISYTVTVTDNAGCTVTDNMQVLLANTYGELKKTLDAGYYQVTNAKLYFSCSAEYTASPLLKYKVYDDYRTMRLNYTVAPPAPVLVSQLGDNRFLLNLSTSFSAADVNKFFTLEVTNEKNEITLLKFKYAQ